MTVTQAEDSDEVAIVLTGRSPDDVAAFYRSALPTAGYQITDDDTVGVGVQVVGLKFTGNGYDGELAVATTPSRSASRTAEAPLAGGPPRW
ncbi:hypothetical protein [Actinophytocola sp.]|uniref:hypothetical protein n=1 Tax=Actinophytocola sp. TaxID=1872138 RepID=UPI003D6A7AF5